MKMLFVLTFKGSIEAWAKTGVANREMEFCFEYLRRNTFSSIQLFTYGTNDQHFLDGLNFPEELKQRIELIAPDKTPRSVFDHLRHSFSLRKVRYAVKNGAKVVRTNQINGCWTALLARMMGCRFLMRCGYILSRRLYKNGKYLQAAVALALEVVSFNMAHIVSVTAIDAVTYARRLLLWKKDRVFIAPTYVNTDLFNADVSTKPHSDRFICISRLEKNIPALIEACHIAKLPLTLVGGGSDKEKKAVTDRARELGIDFIYHSQLSNEDIAQMQHTHRYFVLPSLHEGLPKVVIEAMSGEMICVGTPTSGTTDLIIPDETGYLAKGFTPQEIAEAMRRAVDDPCAETYAKNARAFVLARHAITTYVDREWERIRSAL